MSFRLAGPLSAVAFVAAGALLLGAWHGGTPTGLAPGDAAERPESMEAWLQGTWLREYAADGVQARRVLDLHPDGRFQEAVLVRDARGNVEQHAHEGTWIYDGTNLKRKYTLMDGSPPSRVNLPFVTFEVAFSSRNAFVGVDHIHRNRVEYRRVLPETRP